MNQITIAGVLSSAPAFVDDNGQFQIKVHLKIEREDIGKTEKLMLMSKDEDVIRKVLNDDLKAGDFFFTDDAYVETTNYIQEERWACNSCGEVIEDAHPAEILNVIFRTYQFVRDFTNDGSLIGINHATMTGTLNANPSELDKHPFNGFRSTRAKFKITATSRVNGKTLTNYPFIATFGKEAEQSLENLQKNDKILVEGNVQERRFLKVKKGCVCPNCQKKSNPKIYMVVRELIARNIEYIDVKKIKEKHQEDNNSQEE